MTLWDGAVVLTTERLVLRRYRLDDLDPWAALNTDPEVVRHLGGVALPRAESDAMAAWHNDLHTAEGLGLLAVERRSDSAFLGMCGLHHQETFPDDVEVAWRLRSTYWGRGYATEAASSWLDHALRPTRPHARHLHHRQAERAQPRGDATPRHGLRARRRGA